jgi:membrane protease YdiL (CAAX protease family)
MFPVKCPRCTLVWYSNEEEGGGVRLCSDCSDALKRNRRWDPVRIDAFLIATGIFVLVDLVFIPLAALLPGTFGTPLLVYGAVLSVGAFLVFSGFQGSLYGVPLVEKADWSLMRWPVMIGLVGFACVLAYFSLGIPAWKEKQGRVQEGTGVPRGIGRLHTPTSPPVPTVRAGLVHLAPPPHHFRT